jgi:two-component sensor histidine kinase
MFLRQGQPAPARPCDYSTDYLPFHAMRYLSFLYLLLSLAPRGMAQPMTIAQANQLRSTLNESRPDTQQVQTRLQLGDFYLHKTLHVKPSLDSALTMAQQALTLSRRLGYARGADDAVLLQGSVFIRQRQPERVEQMLQGVSETTQIRLLLELGKSWLRSTMTREVDWSKARSYFGRADTLSRRIHSQRWQEESQQLMGMSYLMAGDWPTSKTYFLPVIQARRAAGDKAGELWALLKWVTASQRTHQEERIQFANRALTLARQLGDKPKQAVLLMVISINYLFPVNLKQAQRAADQAVAIYKAIGPRPIYQTYISLMTESDFIHRAYLIDFSTPYFLLTEINLLKNNLDQALRYYLKIIKEAEANGLPNDLDYLYFMIGNVYYDWNQFDKSIDYYQQSLAVSQQKGEVVIYVGMVRRLVACLLKQGKTQQALTLLKYIVSQDPPIYPAILAKQILLRSFGDCYTALKQYRLAESYYLQALQSSINGQEGMPQNLARLQLGQFYVTTGQFAKASLHLKKLTAFPENYYPLRNRQEIIWLRFKVDSAFGHTASALRHYQRYKTLNDSIFNQTKSQQIAELGIRYETQKKEQDLQLKAKNIALLTQQGQTQKTQRNGLLAGTTLLVALLGLSVNRYRLKQRSNQLLEVKQQQINHKNQELQQLLVDKELLLKEIHHRVKNNLQVVMSLLNSQASYLSDNAALSAIQQSQHRLQSMALIHQKLYQAQGVAYIPMDSYIEEVVAYLRESYELPQPIRFDLQVEAIDLDVTQAVPLGLIINEAITNALKYAFPNDRPGTISLGFHRLRPTAFELRIADDGVGLPPDYDPSRSHSLGMTLIEGFSQQLGGELMIRNNAGLSISLLFQDEQITSTSSSVATTSTMVY